MMVCWEGSQSRSGVENLDSEIKMEKILVSVTGPGNSGERALGPAPCALAGTPQSALCAC